jgi:hypothetical protein
MCAGLTIIGFSVDSSVMFIKHGGTGTLVGCNFTGNTITDNKFNSAILSVNAVNPNATYAQQQDTIVRVEHCTFDGNFADHRVVANKAHTTFPKYEALIFSDDAALEVLYVSDNGEKQDRGHAKPLSGAPADRQGITNSSAWLRAAQKVWFQCSFPMPAYFTHRLW